MKRKIIYKSRFIKSVIALISLFTETDLNNNNPILENLIKIKNQI
jgi:hypothetical protein